MRNAAVNYWRMARFEFSKAFRMRLARVLFGIVVAETLMKAVVFHMRSEDMIGAFASGIQTDGTGYLAALMFTTFNAVNLVALVFASLLVAGETSSGALRFASSLPFSRLSIISAKLAVLGLFVAACVAVSGAINLLMADWLYGIEAVEELDYTAYERGEVIRYYLLLQACAFLPIFAVSCFGLLVSVWSPTSGAAVGVAILTYSAASIYENLQAKWLYLLKMRYDLGAIFSDVAQGFTVSFWAEARTGLLYAAAYAALFAGLAIISFARRDNYS